MTDRLTSIDVAKTSEPTETVATCCDRIAEVDTDVHAFVEEPDRERLLREAETLAERFGHEPPPLFGVPVGVKDVFRTDEYPTRAGSNLPVETFVGPAAEAVTRLRESGASIAGKTVTTEFAYFDPGPTRNPRDLDHTPGGSSSGSAAAVAAGMCPLTLGTQTVGSVIRPAAFCGVVGLKPSYDRIPTDGVVPFSPSADHVGTFTTSVEDATIAASVLCDDWTDVEYTESPVIGVPDGPYMEQADPGGIDRFEAAVDALSEAGYDVRRDVILDDVRSVNERHREMIAAEMALAQDEWFAAHGERYAETTVDLIQEGFDVSVGTLVDARNGRRTLRERLHERMNDLGLDVLTAPAALGPAPRGLDDTGDPVMNLPWTHAGLPVVTVPSGTVDGLPVGMQCIGRFGADERLLTWCGDVEGTLRDVA